MIDEKFYTMKFHVFFVIDQHWSKKFVLMSDGSGRGPDGRIFWHHTSLGPGSLVELGPMEDLADVIWFHENHLRIWSINVAMMFEN